MYTQTHMYTYILHIYKHTQRIHAYPGTHIHTDMCRHSHIVCSHKYTHMCMLTCMHRLTQSHTYLDTCAHSHTVYILTYTQPSPTPYCQILRNPFPHPILSFPPSSQAEAAGSAENPWDLGVLSCPVCHLVCAPYTRGSNVPPAC
jgi:hypothetical protein